jgi:hypothetical protein
MSEALSSLEEASWAMTALLLSCLLLASFTTIVVGDKFTQVEPKKDFNLKVIVVLFLLFFRFCPCVGFYFLLRIEYLKG